MANFLITFVQAQPLLSITLFSFIITVFMTYAYKRFTDQEKMKEFKEKQKEMQKKSKEFKNDPGKLMELQKEMMQLSMEQMKQSFKPMFITFIPLILVFIFMRNLYTVAEVGNIIYWKVNVPVFGDGAGWLLSYIILSLIFNSILRKIMKVH